MNNNFSLNVFKKRFPDDQSCLDEIRKIKYPKGISCNRCKKITLHYQITNRTAFSCKICRAQVFPLVGTIFEKSSTTLSTWFYAMFIMTQTGGDVTIKVLQEELGVTYKTAWKISTVLKRLMEQNNGDLLLKNFDTQSSSENRERTWIFFNTIEIRVAQKNDGKADR